MVGVLSDRFGLLLVFRSAMFLTAVVVSFWSLCESLAAIYAFAFCYGFLAFAYYALLPATVALYYDVKDIGVWEGREEGRTLKKVEES